MKEEKSSIVLYSRTGAVSPLSATATLAWRAMLKIKHVPFQLVDVTITPIMFTLLFTYMFGGALSGSPREYLQYLLPGILVQTIVFITVYTGVGLNTDIQKGLYDRFRSMPIWQPAPILGALLADLFRYSIAALIIMMLGLILGFRPAGGAVGVFIAYVLVMLFAFALTWLWIIFAMKVKTAEAVMTASFVVLMPLTFASSIFVSLETMPPWLQAIVRHNPVTRLANAARALMHGQSATGDILWVVATSLAITAIAAPIALRMYHRER